MATLITDYLHSRSGRGSTSTSIKMSINASTAALVGSLPVSFLEQLSGIPPPPGQTSNFVDPPNLITTTAVVVAISTFLMITAVSLRVYSKQTSGRAFSWEDCKSNSSRDRSQSAMLMGLADTCFLAVVIAYRQALAVNWELTLRLDRWAVLPILASQFMVRILYRQ